MDCLHTRAFNMKNLIQICKMEVLNILLKKNKVIHKGYDQHCYTLITY